MPIFGEGAFQYRLSIALVIKQWLTDDVTEKHAEEK